MTNYFGVNTFRKNTEETPAQDEVLVKKSFLGLHLGDRLIWHVDEFDTVKPIDTPCVITEIFDDHAIATTSDNLHLWIDKDYLDSFRKEVVA